MRAISPLRSLTVTLGLLGVAAPALGQLAARRALTASPPGSAMLGQPVTLSVQGAAQGARYRYVATMTAPGGGTKPYATSCAQTQGIGSGSRVTWQPFSGTYRLTAYGPGRAETDTLSLTYQVLPRTVMLAYSQTAAQPSGVTVVLRTDDLGPGHKYQWWMQYSYVTGGGPGAQHPVLSQPWASVTGGPMATYPTPIPQQAAISAKVSIHRGDPCAIVAVGVKSPS